MEGRQVNKDRRARLEALLAPLSEIKDQLQLIADEEQEAYDNLPESLQSGEKGEKMEENASKMTDAVDHLEEIDEWINDILQQ